MGSFYPYKGGRQKDTPPVTASALPARTFGIELEVIGNMRSALTVLRAAGINAEMPGYNHNVSAAWKLVPDGSVSRGFEVVSPILTGEAGIEQAKIVANALNAAGFTVDTSCGFHVHVGAADLSADDLRTLTKRYAAWEDQIDGWMPRSRRGALNSYCRPVRTVADATDRVPAGTSARDLILQTVGPGNGNRYYKLNLQSFWRHGTVEFRQHSGTVDAAKVEAWTRFCLSFVEASKASGGTGYTPSPVYKRTAKRDYAEVIEQIEAAGLTVTRDRNAFLISGPRGGLTVTGAELVTLYRTPRSFALDAVRFEAFWTAKIACIAPLNDAPDSVFAGVPAAVQAFLSNRAAHFARGGVR